jgi:hypothetical protein
MVRRRSRLTPSGVVIRGTARSRGCSVVSRVEVALGRHVRSGCRFLRGAGSFSAVRPCKRPVWLSARGTADWSLRRRLAVAPGRYLVRTRASDAAGGVERPRHARVLRRP